MCPECNNKLIMSRDRYSDAEYSEIRRNAITDPKSPKGWIKTLIELEDSYQKKLNLKGHNV